MKETYITPKTHLLTFRTPQAGTFTPLAGATACLTCPAHSESGNMSARCACRPGFAYRRLVSNRPFFSFCAAPAALASLTAGWCLLWCLFIYISFIGILGLLWCLQ
jgi:hypothetical protein